MDFQSARNLSALWGAQGEVSGALRHVGACLDCLNREVILTESCALEAEHLLAAARTDLLQVQALLTGQLDEGAERLRAAQVAVLLHRQVQPRTSSDPSEAQHHTVDAPNSPRGVSSCDTRKELEDVGQSYTETVVVGGLHRSSSYGD